MMEWELIGGQDIKSSMTQAPPYHGGSLGPAQGLEKALSATVDDGALATEVDGDVGPVRWPGRGGGELNPKRCS
jgi:hypothetical protein